MQSASRITRRHSQLDRHGERDADQQVQAFADYRITLKPWCGLQDFLNQDTENAKAF